MEYNESMQVKQPLLYSMKPSVERPKQKSLECVLWAVNHCISPHDGGQDALPLETIIRWQFSELYMRLASDVLWPCDFLSEFKRIQKANKTGLSSFQDIRMYLQKFLPGLVFTKLTRRDGKVAAPLSKVICTDHALYVLCFVLSAY